MVPGERHHDQHDDVQRVPRRQLQSLRYGQEPGAIDVHVSAALNAREGPARELADAVRNSVQG